VDYIALHDTDAAMLDAVAVGLCEGARQARVSISGGETAQLKDIVTGFDLVGMAVGRVPLDKVICGRDVRDGDVVIGVRWNGVHSSGLTLARKAFFDGAKPYRIDHKFAELDLTIGEELLKPTDIYVPEALEIIARTNVKALANMTSDGLLNLVRVDAPV